jgi:hypothetical protein
MKTKLSEDSRNLGVGIVLVLLLIAGFQIWKYFSPPEPKPLLVDLAETIAKAAKAPAQPGEPAK